MSPGVAALESSASTAWLYAAAHIRGLRMKEPLENEQASQLCPAELLTRLVEWNLEGSAARSHTFKSEH
jgi:hypothetical protein